MNLPLPKGLYKWKQNDYGIGLLDRVTLQYVARLNFNGPFRYWVSPANKIHEIEYYLTQLKELDKFLAADLIDKEAGEE